MESTSTMEQQAASKFSDESEYCNPSAVKILDIDQPRTELPSGSGGRMNLKKAAQLVKQLIGKDLARYSLPCFLNEPLTILQKSAEFLAFSDLLADAAQE